MNHTSKEVDVREDNVSPTAGPVGFGSSTSKHRVPIEDREPALSDLFSFDSLNSDTASNGVSVNFAGSHGDSPGQTLLSESMSSDFFSNVASSSQNSPADGGGLEATPSYGSVNSVASLRTAMFPQVYTGDLTPVTPVTPNYTITWDPESSRGFIRDHDSDYYANWHHYVPPKPLVHEPAIRKGYRAVVAPPPPAPQQPLRDPPCLTHWKRCTLTEEESARCEKHWRERKAKQQKRGQSSSNAKKGDEEGERNKQGVESRLEIEIAKAVKAAEEAAAEIAALEADGSEPLLTSNSL
jgi:hypothetical protein